MQLQTDKKGTTLVVRLMGSLSEFGVAEQFHEIVSKQLGPDIKHLVYNFNEASLPDSRFIGRMVEIYKNRHDQIKVHVLCDRNEDVKELLLICGMKNILTFLSAENQIPG